jgi:hypothetical protein
VRPTRSLGHEKGIGLRGGADMTIEPCGGKRDDGLTRGQKHG